MAEAIRDVLDICRQFRLYNGKTPHNAADTTHCLFGAKRLTTSGFSIQARLPNKFADGLASDPQRVIKISYILFSECPFLITINSRGCCASISLPIEKEMIWYLKVQLDSQFSNRPKIKL